MNDSRLLIQHYLPVVEQQLSVSRYNHCLRVAEIAAQLAVAHGYAEPDDAYLAGIVHDITKQKKSEFHLQLFAENHFDHTGIPSQAYHAFSAVFVLQDLLQNTEILQSVQSHTLGHGNMSLLEQIVYAADFLGSEYSCRQQQYPQWLQKTLGDLRYGIWLKSSYSIRNLVENGEPIHPRSLDTYNFSLSGGAFR